MKRWLLIGIMLVTTAHSSIDTVSENQTVDYPFLLMDAPARLSSMRQVDESYLSAYRLFVRGLDTLVRNPQVADLIEVGTLGLFFMTFTHEEGHRSILTREKLGSVSVPYFNRHGASYVTGVKDSTLSALRDRNLPVYIRLHTGGLESDYMLTKRCETIGAFAFDNFQAYRWEYLIRKFALLQYYTAGLFKVNVDLREEKDELDRDIVGFDTYGAARHLYRPDIPFYRYTQFDDLTRDERKFIRRSGFRSLLNIGSPLMIGKERFRVNDVVTMTGGTGYTMAPFGDFIDENVWATLYGKCHLSAYVRQFQNEEHWFPAFGAGLHRYAPVKSLSVSASVHLWQQPRNLDFRTSSAETGGAFDLDVSYFYLKDNPTGDNRGISLDIGFLYKTDGFLPEVMYLERHMGLRIGTTLRL